MKKQTKIFLSAFLAAIFLFTFSFGIFYRYTMEKDIRTGIPLLGVAVPDYSASDNICFLVLYDGDLSGKDLFSAVVCCNAATKIITVCELNLSLDSVTDLTHASLREQYRLGGVRNLRQAIENLLHADFNGVIRCGRKELVALVHTLGGIWLQEEGKPEQYCTAPVFLREFSAPQKRSELFFSLINTCFSGSDSLSKTRQLIFRRCDTDLTPFQTSRYRTPLEYLMTKQHFTLLHIPVKRVYMGTVTRYIPNPDALSVLQHAMSR